MAILGDAAGLRSTLGARALFVGLLVLQAAGRAFPLELEKALFHGGDGWESLALTDATVSRGAVRAMPDGGLLVVGDRGQRNVPAALWATRFATDGSIVWTREYGEPWAPGGFAAIGIGRNGEVILSNLPPSGAPLRLARLGSEGDPLWMWVSPPEARSFAWTAGPLGPIVAYATPAGAETAATRVWLSYDGAPLAAVSSSAASDRAYRTLEVGPTGDIWAAGLDDAACFVERLTGHGERVWERRFDLSYSELGCIDLAADAEGRVAAVGDLASGHVGLVVVYDDTGELSWAGLTPGRLIHIAIGEAGDVAVGGVLPVGGPDRGIVGRFDRNGEALWVLIAGMAGTGRLVGLEDRSPVGTLALFVAPDEETLVARLFDRNGSVTEELDLSGALDLDHDAPHVGWDVLRSGRIVLAANARRASTDIWLGVVGGVGELFSSDFETGDLTEWGWTVD